MKDTSKGSGTIPLAQQRRTWVRPAVSRMKAGHAEVGPNPDAADGGFTLS